MIYRFFILGLLLTAINEKSYAIDTNCQQDITQLKSHLSKNANKIFEISESKNINTLTSFLHLRPIEAFFTKIIRFEEITNCSLGYVQKISETSELNESLERPSNLQLSHIHNFMMADDFLNKSVNGLTVSQINLGLKAINEWLEQKSEKNLTPSQVEIIKTYYLNSLKINETLK